MTPNRIVFFFALAINAFCSICTAQNTDMVVRTYPVHRGIMDVVIEPETDSSTNEFVALGQGPIARTDIYADIQDFFEEAGVPFPPGSFMQYEPVPSHLVVRNTEKNHRILIRLLSYPRQTQVHIDVTLVRIPNGDLPAIRQGVILTALDLAKTSHENVVILDSITVTTRSGVNAMAEHRRGKSSATNQMFESTLNVTPIISPDEKTVDVTLIWTITRDSHAQSAATTDSIATSVIVRDKAPLILLARRVGPDGYLEFAVLTVTLVNEAGERLEYTPEGYRTN